MCGHLCSGPNSSFSSDVPLFVEAYAPAFAVGPRQQPAQEAHMNLQLRLLCLQKGLVFVMFIAETKAALP